MILCALCALLAEGALATTQSTRQSQALLQVPSRTQLKEALTITYYTPTAMTAAAAAASLAAAVAAVEAGQKQSQMQLAAAAAAALTAVLAVAAVAAQA
jgi:hypothetical protein